MKKTTSLASLTEKQKQQIDKTVDTTMSDVDQKWNTLEQKGKPWWFIILVIIREIIEAIEELDSFGIKGSAKKELAKTIVECVVNDNKIKVKVFGIPIPFSNKIISKYIVKYSGMIIDWLVDAIFNNDKTKGEECQPQ